MIRRRLPYLGLVGALVLLSVALVWAQGRRGRGRDRDRWQERGPRAGVPEWEVDAEMPDDVFTFVRLRYDSDSYGWGSRWRTDYPDSDYNFSWRLQELTSLEVALDPTDVGIMDKELFDYPFLYMLEVGSLVFHEEEVARLRSYLLRGGFLMVDDFWGDSEWENFAFEIERVFPDRPIVDMNPSGPEAHPIFSCVFDMRDKPTQVPSINVALSGRSSEVRPGDGDPDVHYRGIFDDEGRLMVFICHNTDFGDGWEREGESRSYFKEYAEKRAYPMGINIVYYALTH